MTLYMGSLKVAHSVTKSHRLTLRAKSHRLTLRAKSHRLTLRASSVGGRPVRITYAVAARLPAQMSPAGLLAAPWSLQ
jgi:hypothetical protein